MGHKVSAKISNETTRSVSQFQRFQSSFREEQDLMRQQLLQLRKVLSRAFSSAHIRTIMRVSHLPRLPLALVGLFF